MIGLYSAEPTVDIFASCLSEVDMIFCRFVLLGRTGEEFCLFDRLKDIVVIAGSDKASLATCAYTTVNELLSTQATG